ncbi:MAG: hypothetical protein EA399_15515 [Desulfovibrionales bacterium]|nr:MAG: hypothetical protein EA399_15515 [Desulfovibrionales bacterium]
MIRFPRFSLDHHLPEHYVFTMETQPNSTPVSPPPLSPDFLANPEFRAMVRNELSDILADFIATQEKRAGEVSLIERIIRVEESQRSHEQLSRALLEQMNLRFEAVDKRFVEMLQSMDKRFESMDKRFESLDKRFVEMQQGMDKRFESMDKRFEEMQRNMDKRFVEMQQGMDKRFEAVDKRFESMDKRFDDLSRRMDRFMFWSLGLTVSATFLIISVLR